MTEMNLTDEAIGHINLTYRQIDEECSKTQRGLPAPVAAAVITARAQLATATALVAVAEAIHSLNNGSSQ